MFRMVLLVSLLALMRMPQNGHAQVLGLEESSLDHRTLERLLIKTSRPVQLDPALKPFSREALASWAMALDTAYVPLSVSDRRDLFRIYKNNNEWLVQPDHLKGFLQKRPPIFFTDWEGNEVTSFSHVDASSLHARYVLSKKPIWKLFYRTPSNLYETHSKNFYLKVNPLLRFSFNRDFQAGNFYTQQAGIRLRGGIAERFYFATEILNTQARYPGYVRDYTDYHQALPGNGIFNSTSQTLVDGPEAYNYLNAQGYVGFRIIPKIHAQIGYGRHFIGNGYRSLLLSDFSNNYSYLKVQSQFGLFTYQNIFAELAAFSANTFSDGQRVPKKYLAAHYLSARILPNLHVGLFEATVFHRSQNWKWEYLNPVILYQSVDHLSGSQNHVLLGMNADWSFLNRIQIYGQFILDEFKFKGLFGDNNGWWANKYGYQLGIKAIDVLGVDHLDLQVEYNRVRPYTYQHVDSLSNYTHYNMALAHPLGANFNEQVFLIRYQPANKWTVEARLIYAHTGRDTKGSNYGADLLRNYASRAGDYNQKIAQGRNTELTLTALDVSYELFHQFYIQANWFNRIEQPSTIHGIVHYVGGGIRWNLPDVRMDF